MYLDLDFPSTTFVVGDGDGHFGDGAQGSPAAGVEQFNFETFVFFGHHIVDDGDFDEQFRLLSKWVGKQISFS